MIETGRTNNEPGISEDAAYDALLTVLSNQLQVILDNSTNALTSTSILHNSLSKPIIEDYEKKIKQTQFREITTKERKKISDIFSRSIDMLSENNYFKAQGWGQKNKTLIFDKSKIPNCLLAFICRSFFIINSNVPSTSKTAISIIEKFLQTCPDKLSGDNHLKILITALITKYSKKIVDINDQLKTDLLIPTLSNDISSLISLIKLNDQLCAKLNQTPTRLVHYREEVTDGAKLIFWSTPTREEYSKDNSEVIEFMKQREAKRQKTQKEVEAQEWLKKS